LEIKVLLCALVLVLYCVFVRLDTMRHDLCLICASATNCGSTVCYEPKHAPIVSNATKVKIVEEQTTERQRVYKKHIVLISSPSNAYAS